MSVVAISGSRLLINDTLELGYKYYQNVTNDFRTTVHDAYN